MAQEDRPSQNDAPYRLLVEAVRDYAIFMLDPKGYVLSWNTGAQLIKGYAAGEIIGRHFSTFYPAEAVARGHPDEELTLAARDGRFEEEGWRVRKDGSRFWANVVITALRDPQDALVGFAKVTRDLTQRRAHEEAIRQSEDRFRLLVDRVTEYAFFMLDVNGYVVTWNSGAHRIKGYGADEIVGKHFRVFYPKEVAASGYPERELQSAAAEGTFMDAGWRIRKDGSRFWAHVTISALRDDEGRLRGFAKLTRDMTESKRAEALESAGAEREALLDAERSARIEAQRATRIKDEFLATLSHELRTPLSAILGWAQVLRTKGKARTAEEVDRGMEIIERNARAQVKLIDDLLDLSRIMGGRMRLDVQELSLLEVVQAVVDSIEPSAHAKNVRLEAVLDPQGIIVSGDASRLQQVFWNLLTNAVKFTPKGGRIQVVLQRINSHVEVSVADTGIGIAPDYLPLVFDRFSQADTSLQRRQGGLGLGLAICKQLVELHGGTVHAKSLGAGNGATFIVHLPLAVSRSAPKAGQRVHPTSGEPSDTFPLPRLEGIRVLVVDDEPDARSLIGQLLEEQGATVTMAASAGEALERLQTDSPDVLISDVGMPDVDGYQFIRRLRAMEPKRTRLPALALTAFARPDDRKQAILAGYQAHLAKPFDVAEFIIVIAGLVGRT